MIFLKPMSEEEYKCYMVDMIPNYKTDLAKARDLSPSNALTMADKQIANMLPNGLNSPENYFYIIKSENDSANLGYLWLLLNNKDNNHTLFICDIEVGENYRGKKIGTRTLELVEKKAKEFNCKSVSLHVFGHNTGARKLYETSEYEPINVYMKKIF